MDHLQKFTSQFRDRVALLLFVNNLIIIADWWIADKIFELTGYWLLVALIIGPFITLTFLPWLGTRYLVQPTKLIWQAILHIAPDTANTPAPNLKQSHLGRELVTNLVSQVYQLASVAQDIEKTVQTAPPNLKTDFVANSMPLPLVILSKDDTILFANDAMLKYIGRAESETTGQNVYSVLDLSFTNTHTLDVWLKDAKANKAVATQSWERVRLNLGENNPQFDLSAYYNKNNPQGFETMLVLFDHTQQYSQDDQAMSYVAIAVHELRTPLTLLRGYIEAFEEELDGKLDPEMQGFMRKMNAASQQLSAFVSNILNVARIENDQLTLKLQKEQWADVVKAAVDDLRLRADVRGITLELQAPSDLPPVAVDRMTMYEVIANLVDNAIKYSGASKKIVIKTYLTKDGLVETTVQDYGVGIPANIVPHLFDKFYRSHRNRAQIGGTGLGLFLSKAIVNAHDGHIWVRSTEGQGSTFGFTVHAYSDNLAARGNMGDTSDIVRTAHGWIKNHSMYRR
ncbi:MAG TPA: ATP-binding protein [Nevskiaceae bacterium]|nr:ATP-binding protein [Nevskiaceae bacterium]